MKNEFVVPFGPVSKAQIVIFINIIISTVVEIAKKYNSTAVENQAKLMVLLKKLFSGEVNLAWQM